MRHHTVLQRSDNKLWHYVSRHDSRGTYPIGNCAVGCEGHETEEGAREHARQYLLEHLTFIPDSDRAQSQHRCDKPDCQEFTSGYGMAPWGFRWTLCEKHRTAQAVDELLASPLGDSWTTMGP